jgi:uncharacterized protein (TIGR02646 family)
MVELQHRANVPPELLPFANALVAEFDSPEFQPTKRVVKAALHADQGGLCVYCEQYLDAQAGHIEHIKPKGGPHAHPHLCFLYANFAHSCSNDRTCGHKKGAGLLPTEPGPGCNAEWVLLTDGAIDVVSGLTRSQKQRPEQTRDMLGLNNPVLCQERKKYVHAFITVLKEFPNDASAFLVSVPFRHILTRV